MTSKSNAVLRCASPSRRHPPILVIHVLCILLLTLCCGSATVAGDDVKQVRHRNGLVLVLPADLVVTEMNDGFSIDPGAVRSLGPISVRLGAAGADDAGWTDKHEIDGCSVRYRIDDLGEGGSGGAEYAITAWESSPAGDIVYRHSAQSELGQPDFALFWRIVDQTRVSGGN